MDINNLKQQLRNLSKPHLLYLIILQKDGDAFCKIGITTTDINTRVEPYRKLGYAVDVIKILNSEGTHIRAIESLILERVLDHSQKKIFPYSTRFDGYSECYNINYLPQVSEAFELIQKYLKRRKYIHEDVVDETVRLWGYKLRFREENEDMIPPYIWQQICEDSEEFYDYDQLRKKYLTVLFGAS